MLWDSFFSKFLLLYARSLRLRHSLRVAMKDRRGSNEMSAFQEHLFALCCQSSRRLVFECLFLGLLVESLRKKLNTFENCFGRDTGDWKQCRVKSLQDWNETIWVLQRLLCVFFLFLCVHESSRVEDFFSRLCNPSADYFLKLEGKKISHATSTPPYRKCKTDDANKLVTNLIVKIIRLL